MTDMDEAELISIGELASRTGISVDTIRVWERRYGQPVAVRLPSGHRRYTQADVRRLRRVAETLAMGHRPSTVLRLSEKEVDAILAAHGPSPVEDQLIASRLERIRAFDRTNLVEDFERILAQDGVRALLLDHLMPLAASIGRAWADGGLEIRHEHFASELMLDLVRQVRGRIPPPEQGPVILHGTLEGETHSLGVQVGALFTCLGGGRPRIMGVNMPNDELVAAARECEARAVAVSVSLATGGVETDRIIGDLRKRLPPEVDLVVGGSGARGARRGPKGVRYVSDFLEFEQFVQGLGELTRSA